MVDYASGQCELRARRILVVDDEQIVLDMMRKMLRKLGYTGICVSDGADAINTYMLEKQIGRDIDIVIMDLTIPGKMSGKEAINRLKYHDPHSKIIATSGYSDDPFIADWRDYGLSGALIKPYGLEQLRSVLLSAIFNFSPARTAV